MDELNELTGTYWDHEVGSYVIPAPRVQPAEPAPAPEFAPIPEMPDSLSMAVEAPELSLSAVFDGPTVDVTVSVSFRSADLAAFADELGLTDREHQAFLDVFWPDETLLIDEGDVIDAVRQAAEADFGDVISQTSVKALLERVLGAQLRDAISRLSPERQRAALRSGLVREPELEPVA